MSGMATTPAAYGNVHLSTMRADLLFSPYRHLLCLEVMTPSRSQTLTRTFNSFMGRVTMRAKVYSRLHAQFFMLIVAAFVSQQDRSHRRLHPLTTRVEEKQRV